jgi:ribosomal protein L22
VHAAYDEAKAAHQKYVVAARKAREAGRKVREQKAEEARERLLNEIVGAAYRKAEREQRLTGAVRSVAGCLKYMLRERRNDFSAEAITALINRPDSYPLELVTEALAKLKADSAYDRILAEPVE